MEFVTHDFGIIEKLPQLSPSMLLVLSLNFILWALKLNPRIDTWMWLLALITIGVGALVYPRIANVAMVSHEIEHPRDLMRVHGCVLGGLSVAINYAFRKGLAKFGAPSGDTKSVRKKDRKHDERDQLDPR